MPRLDCLCTVLLSFRLLLSHVTPCFRGTTWDLFMHASNTEIRGGRRTLVLMSAVSMTITYHSFGYDPRSNRRCGRSPQTSLSSLHGHCYRVHGLYKWVRAVGTAVLPWVIAFRVTLFDRPNQAQSCARVNMMHIGEYAEPTRCYCACGEGIICQGTETSKCRGLKTLHKVAEIYALYPANICAVPMC